MLSNRADFASPLPAELFVNGQFRAAGYSENRRYQINQDLPQCGVCFSVSIWYGPRSTGIVHSLRLDIAGASSLQRFADQNIPAKANVGASVGSGTACHGSGGVREAGVRCDGTKDFAVSLVIAFPRATGPFIVCGFSPNRDRNWVGRYAATRDRHPVGATAKAGRKLDIDLIGARKTGGAAGIENRGHYAVDSRFDRAGGVLVQVSRIIT